MTTHTKLHSQDNLFPACLPALGKVPLRCQVDLAACALLLGFCLSPVRASNLNPIFKGPLLLKLKSRTEPFYWRKNVLQISTADLIFIMLLKYVLT